MIEMGDVSAQHISWRGRKEEIIAKGMHRSKQLVAKEAVKKNHLVQQGRDGTVSNRRSHPLLKTESPNIFSKKTNSIKVKSTG